ncbi:MAG: hypothetical protein PWR03_2271, partial [Tenuifilum sp.]|uniref:hypothetical protein n=1 Tax=Tenuifilum sp. TaxID=2760880 RepID=UPI0024AA1DBF
TEFSRKIQSNNDKQIKNWLGRLIKYNIVLTTGKTKGLRYFVNPKLLMGTDLAKTDLSNIMEHRLQALILEDIEKFPRSSIKEIHDRIGKEIPIRRIRKVIYDLIKEKKLLTEGSKKFRKYFIDKNKG